MWNLGNNFPPAAVPASTAPITSVGPVYNATPYDALFPSSGYSWTGAPGRFQTPSGVLPPPGRAIEARELQVVRQLNQSMKHAEGFTEYLDDKGGYAIWMDFAKQYRERAGFVRGWLGTGLVAATMGINALKTQRAKGHYDRLRPYQLDPTIKLVGHKPKDRSYPSGHASSAYSASTVLSFLWPQRATEFNWWAQQVAFSRVAAGAHWPSDIVTGARLGQKTGLQMAELVT